MRPEGVYMDQGIKKVSLGQHLVIAGCVAVGIVFALKDFAFKGSRAAASLPVATTWTAYDNEPIVPIPLTLTLDENKMALGERLYHDPRLSHDDQISCASCHDLKKGGTDQVRYSTGIKGALGGINSPTTFNSGFLFAQFWDGRAADLEEQAVGPVHNPVEMGSSWEEVLVKLNQDPDYPKAFAAIYPDGITATNITDAIAVFERSLFTPNSRFDQFLRV